MNPRNLNATYEPADGLPEGGLCENCKRIGQMTGMVEVPGMDNSGGGS